MLILASTCSAAGSVFISEAKTSAGFFETKMFQDMGFVENFQKTGIISNGKETTV